MASRASAKAEETAAGSGAAKVSSLLKMADSKNGAALPTCGHFQRLLERSPTPAPRHPWMHRQDKSSHHAETLQNKAHWQPAAGGRQSEPAGACEPRLRRVPTQGKSGTMTDLSVKTAARPFREDSSRPGSGKSLVAAENGRHGDWCSVADRGPFPKAPRAFADSLASSRVDASSG